jgi:zeaxanthin glucosyltransferase
MLNSLPAMLTAAGVDAVVIDTSLIYAELAPMSLGMPYAHVANALHKDYSGYTPICFYDWPHETTPGALARNRKGVESFLEMLAPTIAVARAYAKRAGLDVDWDNPSATISKLAWISQTPRVFDFEKFALAAAIPLHWTFPRWCRPHSRRFPMGAADRRASHLCVNGNNVGRFG